ncbi:alpha/beta hydrolase [Actinokineospora sp. G85]|uniref:alpha/beta hydrolase n=1 Tax=Actinokineospora sp. G85 TaxID=3406626 RepID=UPI003C73E8EA
MRVGRWTWLAPIALLAACTAGPSTRPGIVVNDGAQGQPPPSSAANEPVPVPGLGAPENARVPWSDCTPEVADALPPTSLPTACARFNSILDSPYLPGQGLARLSLVKVGSGPVPVLVFNDVDGLPGTAYAVQLAAALPPELMDQFSLVGVDRRGTGRSEPARCVPEDTRYGVVGIDPRSTRSDDLEAAVDQARTAGQQCLIGLEARLPALDTWRAAGDAEVLRTALGMPKLHAIGHGEGARVLSVFADRHPDKVGRMVLDGLPDPNPDAKVGLEGVAAGAEAAFTAFAEDCRARSCELGDARTALTEALATAGSTPVVTEDGVELGPGVVLRAVLAGLADRRAWPALSQALADLRGGVGAGVAALVDPMLTEGDVWPATFDGTLITTCNDTKSRLSTRELAVAAEEWNTRYPFFGGLLAQRLALCSPWPIPSQELPQPSARTAPPIVVIATATDPVTPLRGTERAAQQLATAALVTWQGVGHGALGPSACATEAARAFLVDGKAPRDGTVCPP